MKGAKMKRLWRSAVPELVPGPEFCPTAMDAYLDSTRSRNKTHDNVRTRFLQHLLFLGWEIETPLDKEINRLRYRSPWNKSFYSLKQVCATILGRPIPSETPPIDGNSDPTPSENPSFPGMFSKLCTPSDEVVIEPEYCPEAVHRFTSLNSDSDMESKEAKQHLSAIGWSFYYTTKADNRKELSYCSPKGKVFTTLLSACKWCVEAGALTFDDLMGNGNGNKKRILNAPPKRKRDDYVQVSKSKPKKKRRKSQLTKRVRETFTLSYNRNPRTVLSWLIDSGELLPREKVEYRNMNGQTMADGRIFREGIKCNCCGEIFSMTKFEAHAGCNNHRPSEYIFLEDGRSLMDCHIQMCESKRQRKTENVGTSELINDDVCSSCHYGGELVLCDQCPSSYHTQCLGLEEVPDGDWFCPSCSCRICGRGRHDYEKNGKDLLTCTQCENKYHTECHMIKGRKKCYPEGYWFCQDTCEQIFCGLHKILGKPFSVGAGSLTWTLLKYLKHDSCDQYPYNNDEYVSESYGKLNVALSMMHECFDPIKQGATGRDLVEDVIFSKWSELNRMNFRGFYTVVLEEKNEDMISAATVRIHGKRVAEVPLVATQVQYRRRGMCRILMDELEKKLVDLGVESLVLPAVPDVVNTWTNSFGFSVMNETDRLKFLDCTFLDFHGTTLCHKVLKRKATGTHGSKNGSIDLNVISPMSEALQ